MPSHVEPRIGAGADGVLQKFVAEALSSEFEPKGCHQLEYGTTLLYSRLVGISK